MVRDLTRTYKILTTEKIVFYRVLRSPTRNNRLKISRELKSGRRTWKIYYFFSRQRYLMYTPGNRFSLQHVLIGRNSPNKILGPPRGLVFHHSQNDGWTRARCGQWPSVELFPILFPTSVARPLTFFFIFKRKVCLPSLLIVFDKKPGVPFFFSSIFSPLSLFLADALSSTPVYVFFHRDIRYCYV